MKRKSYTLGSLELLEDIAKRVEKKQVFKLGGIDPAELLGEDAKTYHKVPDTLDVWFDSGSTYASVVEQRPEFNGKSTDMYLEGSDQHRGWFMSSLMLSTATNNKGTL